MGTHESVSNCKRMDRIADSPVGSTEIPDPAKQTESPIQIDFMKIGTTSELASLGDTPPSSDSGVHSLGEQWENMSTSSMDMESEQNDRPTNGSPRGRHVSDTRVPPNTEEDEDINYPWTDYLLNEESDDHSSIDIQQNGRKIQYNEVTICENENSSMNSDDDEETQVEQLSGCAMPGCQCEGRIEFMEWGSEDMTETDDSEYEGPIDRANRLYVESYNYDLSEGMTPKTYTPPLRKNRRRRYEVRKKNKTKIEESISVTSDGGFQTDEESPKSEPTVQPRTVADEDIPTVGDKKDNRGRRTRIGSDKDISSDAVSNLFDRPVTESATAWAGRDSHGPSEEYWKNFGRPVTEAMTEMARNDANISGDDYSDVKQIARETMRAWAENNAEPVEQRAGCRVPGCQCEGRIEYMEWGSEDMTETDDSEYEDPIDRANRLYVESCNYDLSEGMTPKTYTPPLRKNRRRRYEVRKKNETDIEESISGSIDHGFLTDEESPNSEPTVQPRTVADEDIHTVRDRKDNRGRRRRTESDKDISSDFSVCQTMDGAALVDDRSGVTFNAELCIPWDAPEAVVDIDSAELVSLGSFPDKVGLFGRRKDETDETAETSGFWSQTHAVWTAVTTT